MQATDVSAVTYAPSIPMGMAYVDIQVSKIRGVVAKRLFESKTTFPLYYLTVDCYVDQVNKLRAKVNK